MKTLFALLAVLSLVVLPRSVMAQAAQEPPSSRRLETQPTRPMVEMYQKLHADMQASDAQLAFLWRDKRIEESAAAEQEVEGVA